MTQALAYKDYPSTAQQFTSTSPIDASDLGLLIDSTASANWKLQWKLAFSYSTTSAAPIFSISEPGANYWGSEIQLYFEFDYGPGCIQNYDSSTSALIGSYNAPNYPSAANVYHIMTITALITGYTGALSNSQNIVYPTIAVKNSGDVCRILQGYGVVTGF